MIATFKLATKHRIEEPMLECEWLNKVKVLQQVPGERGFIDPSKASVKDYIVNDKMGCKLFRTIVAQLRDFENEESRLQLRRAKAGPNDRPVTKVPS
jgi:hypothetical protein